MSNFEFLKTYYDLQHTVMLDEIRELEFAKIGHNDMSRAVWWNNALVNKKLTPVQIKKIESYFTSINREPAFYFEHRKSLAQLIQDLEDSTYHKAFEDSWMFISPSQKFHLHFSGVKKVETESVLEQFLSTFNDCYQKNDPQNPYGELGDYLDVTKRVWHRHRRSNRLEYFMVFRGNKPVAVSTLTSFNGIGYISNVGSLRSVRGKGFGKIATLYCVAESIKNGNSVHCLATEEGTYPNEFYRRIGFATKFTAVGYAKAV